MKVIEEIQTETTGLAVYHQASHPGEVLICCDQYIGTLDLLARRGMTILREKTTCPSCSTARFAISGDPHFTKDYTLEKVSADPNLLQDFLQWQASRISHLNSICPDGSCAWEIGQRSPTTWRFAIHGKEQGRFLALDEDPVILRYQNYYYIFVRYWDKTLRVYHCPIEEKR